MSSVEERVFSGLALTDEGCWEWTRTCVATSRGRPGYGYISADGRGAYVHRWVYEFLVGPIPEGLHIDHLCRNTRCANPEHLEPVTPAINTQRWYDAVGPIAACVRGHEFTPENTYISHNGTRRTCKACDRLRGAAYRARRAAVA